MTITHFTKPSKPATNLSYFQATAFLAEGCSSNVKHTKHVTGFRYMKIIRGRFMASHALIFFRHACAQDACAAHPSPEIQWRCKHQVPRLDFNKCEKAGYNVKEVVILSHVCASSCFAQALQAARCRNCLLHGRPCRSWM